MRTDELPDGNVTVSQELPASLVVVYIFVWMNHRRLPATREGKYGTAFQVWPESRVRYILLVPSLAKQVAASIGKKEYTESVISGRFGLTVRQLSPASLETRIPLALPAQIDVPTPKRTNGDCEPKKPTVR